MSNERNILRDKAKKAYKEAIKGVPKKRRIPFADFYKQYKNKSLKGNDAPVEDFDFDKLISVNNGEDRSDE